MNPIMTQPTELALWYAAINEAEQLQSIQLHHGVEGYVVMMLQRYTAEHPELAEPIAIELLEACQNAHSQIKQAKLQQLGDRCLLLSGLFPESASRRNVSVDYYINAGKTAYATLHDVACHYNSHSESIYADLHQKFVEVTKVLAGLRPNNTIQILDQISSFKKH